MFCEEEQEALRKKLLATPQAKQIAPQFAEFRGYEHLVKGSDLETIAELDRVQTSDLTCEAERGTEDNTDLPSTVGVPIAAAGDSASAACESVATLHSVIAMSDVIKEELAASMQENEGAGGSVHKFSGQHLSLGHPADSDLREILGLEDNIIFGQGMLDPTSAMRLEWHEHGNDEDRANFLYVVHGRACDPKWIPKHVKENFSSGLYHGGAISEADFDTGHSGWELRDFLDLPSSRQAGLRPEHVIALRLYSSSSYSLFNGPMRSRTLPHPIKFTMYVLNEALRKLKKVSAKMNPHEYNKVKSLWRGMRNMSKDLDKFISQGGTELAAMSTSEHYEVARSFATTLGLKWVEVGVEKPTVGNEIINEALATALENQKEFTKAQFEDFQIFSGLDISDLTESSYIKVVDSYFKPDTTAGCALIFEFVTQGHARGVDIGEFSMFPKEREFLYPPLTYLMLENEEGIQKQKDGTVVVRVIPQMP